MGVKDYGDEKRAAINVKSISKDSRLVYWVNKNFEHPLTHALRSLDPGFHDINNGDDLALDYQRNDPPIVSFKDGRLLPHDLPGPDNDVLDQLVPIVEAAIERKSKVYIFGSSFGTGIHDVHMNQGSLPRFDNGVGQDGGLIVHFTDTDHFEAVFLAFASQRVPTDDETGLALDDSQALSKIAKKTVLN